MIIEPNTDSVGSHKTGELIDITVDEINELLKFTPNIKDDPYKVKHSWQFKVDDKYFSIWDYKGSHLYKTFSTYGSSNIFSKIFGSKYKPYL